MIGLKRFFSIIITTILLSFAVNNWVVLAHADSLSIAKSSDEEEIKSVLNSYFELRYVALSTLELGDFDNLVATSPDAKPFLESEFGKLEIEIKHANPARRGSATPPSFDRRSP